MFSLLLILVALIFFALAACNLPSRIGLAAVGLFCWCLADHLAQLHI